MDRQRARPVTDLVGAFLLVFLSLWSPAVAASDSPVLDLSLEELLQIKVTSPAKKAQPLQDVAAAIHVLTAEDLRRSGVASIPDALRMVPGLQVARIDASKWAISCRGFNDRFANKMLVLVDGRTVYTELFAGVFWDALDTMLEDVERIEVIRGPGASVWGANAVNGVVNIITRSADQTQDGFVQMGGASHERRALGLRYGGRAGEHGNYRVYGKYTRHDAMESGAGDLLSDRWHNSRFGFRYDWAGSAQSDFSLIGEYFDGRCGSNTLVPQFAPPYSTQVNSQDWSAGRSLKGRWTRRSAGGAEIAAQAYYTHVRQGYKDLLAHDADEVDLEGTQSLALGAKHSLMMGVGYRMTAMRTVGSSNVHLSPANATSNLFNGFTQYDVRVLGDRLHLLVGTKVEHKNSSGWDVQPTARALYRPMTHHAFWVASSRAVRTPSRAEQSAVFRLAVIPPDPRTPGAPSTVVTSRSGPEFRSEELWAMEGGYRGYYLSRFQVDVTGFANHYDHLRSGRLGTAYLDVIDGNPYVIAPLTTHNDLAGWTKGVELSGTMQATPWCRLGASHTRLSMDLKRRDGAPEEIMARGLGNDPRRQASAHVSMDLGRHLQVYTAMRYVGALPDPGISSYLVGDLNTAWIWSPQVTTVLGVRDIGSGNRVEFEPLYVRSTPAAIPTSVYGYLTVRY